MKLIIAFAFLSITASAQIKSNLYQKKEEKSEAKKNSLIQPKAANNEKNKVVLQENGNLPSYLMNRKYFQAEESPIVVPAQRQIILNVDLTTGEVVSATLKESLIAFSEAKAPIRAIITNGKLKGQILIGEATLERNSKRILVTFNKLNTISNRQNWSMQGSALDGAGVLGLEGKLYSGEEKFFAVEFLSAAAAGYADATIKRSQNNQGNYVEEPGTDTFMKKALVAALSKTTDRFGEKLKTVPEYAVLKGPIEIQVLITEQPKLIE